MTKKLAVKKAIEAIDSGDARGLRKHINEALVTKVRKALDAKEKEIAKTLIESATKRSIQEAENLNLKSTGKNILKSEVLSLAKNQVSAGQDVISLFNKAFGSSSSISFDALVRKMQDMDTTEKQNKKIGAVFFYLSTEIDDLLNEKNGSLTEERNEDPVFTPSKTNIPVSNAQCVVIHTGDDYSEFTGKKVVSGLKKGDKFTASSTNDILSKLKCDKHQIQKDELKDIKAGAKTLYVFVCPFHAEENGERVAQIFADPKEAQDWYDEARNYGSPMSSWT